MGTSCPSSSSPSAAPTAGIGDQQGCQEGSRSSPGEAGRETVCFQSSWGLKEQNLPFFFFFYLAIAEPPVLLVMPVLHLDSHKVLIKAAQPAPRPQVGSFSPSLLLQPRKPPRVCPGWLWTGLCTGPALHQQAACYLLPRRGRNRT